MEATPNRIGPDSILSEIVDRFPETGPILLQQGRMFRAPKGHLYADYSRMTVGEYAALNRLEVEPLLRMLNAAVESGEMTRQTSHDKPPPSDPVRRGAAIGYTSAYRDPGDLDIQDVVTAQTSRGPE
jgi:hypothetical protein